MRITAVENTDLFVGSQGSPRQVVRVTLAGPRPVGARVWIEGPMVRTPEPAEVPPGPDEVTVEVGVALAAPATPGTSYPATATARAGDGETALETALETVVEAAETGWTMWMISHFHYDPVWWNTQAAFTETWDDLPLAQEKRMPFQYSAFDLVSAHLEAARQDEDYKFVLAEVDYLKPYWDSFPRDRRDFAAFLREGKIEIVGGNYNEANTNLTHPESTIRNAVHGVAYQRDVIGADPRSAWMLDVFGHDPSYPGLMADAGLDSSVWARGPWHHVGARRHAGDITRMQFPSEFEWISPSGRGLLTAYLADHYVAGWDLERVDTLEEAMAAAYRQFSSLRTVAASRNVLLPVGHDHNMPSRYCTQVQRAWNARYVWPRFMVGLPREFTAAVRADLASSGTVLTPQTRDMNPVYTGKDVSYIDTKQANRAAEAAVLDGERVASLAALLGAPYPDRALDKAWRLLVYGAHHDAITGTESDQVYLDLLNGWREADELGREVLEAAIEQLAACVDTTGEGVPVMVVNTLSWSRDAVVTVTVPAQAGARVLDAEGGPVAAVTEARDEASLTLTFLARDLPGLGYAVFRVVEAAEPPAGWTADPGAPVIETIAVIENTAYTVEADPLRGGALSRVYDRRTGRELLRPGALGGELVLQREHEKHPVWEEGPWHLLPAGPGTGTGTRPARVRRETSPVGERLVGTVTLAGLMITQETVLWTGLDRVDLRVHVDGSIGHDHLLRARFDLEAPGALPVAEVGFAAVGRSFGFPDVDAAEHLWTLDSPAHTWAGLSATARLRLNHADGTVQDHAIGVAEVVAPADPELAGPVRALMAALAAKGVTATCTRPDGERYGSLDVDSNLPDVRIVLGADHVLAGELLATADGLPVRAALAAHGRVFLPATATARDRLIPDADLRGPRDLPVVIMGGDLAAGIADLIDDLGDAVVEIAVPDGLPGTAEPLDDYSIAVVNRGTPGFVADPSGSLLINLMRSCSGWPSGVWIDGERRTAPGGSGFAWQNWSHTFDLSLVSGRGDWREAGFVRAGQEVNHPLRGRTVTPGDGALPARLGLVTVDPPARVAVTALKPSGDPLARGAEREGDPVPALSLRLYETAGSPVRATVAVHGGLIAAARTDLLEGPGGEALPLAGGVLTLDLPGADVATLRLVPASRAPLAATTRAREVEPVQPVFTRYWLHNAGPAPLGNLPVSIRISPSRLRLVENPGELLVTVACSGRTATGEVELHMPPGVVVTSLDPLHYKLVPGEHAEFRLRITAATPGRHLLAVRIRDDAGQLLEDTTELLLGPTPDTAELVTATLLADSLDLVPGGTALLPVRLRNHADSEIRGELTLISPLGTWSDDLTVGPRAQPFRLPPATETTLQITATARSTARPGAHWWALARLTTHGTVHYTETIPVRITPA